MNIPPLDRPPSHPDFRSPTHTVVHSPPNPSAATPPPTNENGTGSTPTSNQTSRRHSRSDSFGPISFGADSPHMSYRTTAMGHGATFGRDMVQRATFDDAQSGHDDDDVPLHPHPSMLQRRPSNSQLVFKEDLLDKQVRENGESGAQNNTTLNGPASPGLNAISEHPRGSRLLIVANRLPLSMSVKKKRGADGVEYNEMTFSSSSGGLVSALQGCSVSSSWIGWPGTEVKKEADRELVADKLKTRGCLPVFLAQKLCDQFYNGFCNNVIWPLFHYIPLPVEAIQDCDEQFQAYKEANQAFAEVVLANYTPGDTVWVHDYHLMLLPHILRQKVPDMKIGFFLHTPFPSSEIFRMLPSRSELLIGVLSADLIGFHTTDYMHHFVTACKSILAGVEHPAEHVLAYHGHHSSVGTFPIGIDPHKFMQYVAYPKVQEYIEEYKKQFEGKKVILGIDRLDYIKGIAHKLYGIERFFERHPDQVNKVVFVQIAVPSRTDVVEYQKLKATTHELVGRVNGKFGSVSSVPIHYLDQSIPFDRMCALYRVADVMYITSIRDGMNLVAYEYIACQQDCAGVLILSEFAGAAQSLAPGHLQINPWSITEISNALYVALTMSEDEKKKRNEICFRHVTTCTAQAWAQSFTAALALVPTHVPILTGELKASEFTSVQDINTKPNTAAVDDKEFAPGSAEVSATYGIGQLSLSNQQVAAAQ